jgi:4-hydroxy-3-methylbut-2-enyl diphosphate reductase|tara:strand:+ start:2323 stop:3264 length:942 start_codon:yes stop_codon:yes gene_type:complete
MKKDLKIFLASPRGFCAGVDRAVEIVNKSLFKFGSPVYVRHEIVHNKHVVEELRKKGAIFVNELSEINDKSRPVIFSAHGVSKKVIEEAKIEKLFFVDATCPLVSKVHREAEMLYKKEYKILLIGHKGHPEVIGTMGQLPVGSVELIEKKEDILNLRISNEDKVAYITQTTLSIDDTSEIVNALKTRFPKIKEPIKSDICYATTNRQNAVKQIANKCDLFIVIGSRSSSNSKRLVEVAKKSGCKESLLLHSEEILPRDKIMKAENLGISSGASAPEILVEKMIEEIKNLRSVKIEEFKTVDENVSFKLPSELR